MVHIDVCTDGIGYPHPPGRRLADHTGCLFVCRKFLGKTSSLKDFHIEGLEKVEVDTGVIRRHHLIGRIPFPVDLDIFSNTERKLSG